MSEVRFPYEPRPHFIDFHSRSSRWAALVCHRRMGKTVAVINDIIAKAVYSKKRNPRYAYIAPYYRQAKDVAWEYLKYYAGDAIKGKPRESELRVELFNGAWITLYGADNPDALRGLYFDGVVLDEYGDCRPSLWGEVLLPTLADRKGWAVFIGTPKGKNHFYTMYQRSMEEASWYGMKVKASQSGIIDAEELEAMRQEMTEAQYEQEMECSFDAAVLGTYYAKLIGEGERKGRIKPGVAPHNPELPVHVAADVGIKDSTTMWFWQEGPDGCGIIDYEEHSGEPMKFYFDLLTSKGYDYERLWLPHDANARSFQTGRSTLEQFLEADFPVELVPKLSVQHGIDAARLFLPYCYFDTGVERVANGVEALRAYRRQWDEKKSVFADKPLHDWASDGADAFRYMALVAKDRILPKTNKDVDRMALVAGGPAQYTLDQLFEARESMGPKLNTGRI